MNFDIIEKQIEVLATQENKYSRLINANVVPFFEQYYRELIDWNQKINLISRKDHDRIVCKHFVESLSILHVAGIKKSARIIDVGTGAGFPGIPIKIIRPDIDMTLLDSKRNKMIFLGQLISVLGLSNISLVNERAENIIGESDYRCRFDIVIARAVTNLSTLWKWAGILLKENGFLLALKGNNIIDEIRTAPDLQESCLQVIPVVNQFIDEQRELVVVKIDKKS
ncbi:16S rRNA (guanine(527)-N(7))-methyltransferase RsmG [candidate division KSB1 bacterium]|nr:16S rRNA (guanine(527)-N(7))-methyltransferase RsmG [candidate division KSB1 bacterium]